MEINETDLESIEDALWEAKLELEDLTKTKEWFASGALELLEEALDIINRTRTDNEET